MRLHYHVPGLVRPGARIAVVGEAPGKDEAAKREPFVGPSGKLLDHLLTKAGIPRSMVTLTNVLKCHPKENRLPTDLPMAIDACHEIIDRDVRDAAVIVGLGNVPLRAFTGKDRISTRRGSVYALPDGRPYVATLHPAFLIRSKFAQGAESGEAGGDKKVVPREVVIADLAKARRILDGEPWPVPERFALTPTSTDLSRFRDRLYAPEAFVAVDIETTRARPIDAVPLIISFTLPDYWTVTVSFEEDLDFIADALASPTPKVPHGGIFDVIVLRNCGFRVNAYDYDTLYMHHLLYAELPHNLGFVASVHTMLPAWKGMRKEVEEVWEK